MTEKQEMIVVGCGVIGLSTAIRLLERYSVKVIAQNLPPETISDVAAAYWKPFRILQQEAVRDWSRIALDDFYSLAKVGNSGVSITTLLHLLDKNTAPPWWMELVRESRRVAADELPAGFENGYVLQVPKIETPIYMPYLLRRFLDSGGAIEKVDQSIKVSDFYGARQTIVNCTGIGAHDFCPDEKMFPIRGQVIRVSTSYAGPIVDYDMEPSYVVPRTNDCILGGTAQENDWNIEPDSNDAESILERCRKVCPAISDCKILEHKVGLRPGRKEVRLEIEKITDSCTVIHNYGHGRAGFTLSWGCAQAVLLLANSLMDYK